MQLASFILQLTDKSHDEVFSLVDPLVRLYDPGDGTVVIEEWDAGRLGRPRPTDAEITSALASPEPAPPAPVATAEAKRAALASVGFSPAQIDALMAALPA